MQKFYLTEKSLTKITLCFALSLLLTFSWGVAFSAPQPPGSTFKIITLATALQAGIATPSSTYPVRSFATLSGTKLRNASNESCGGSLTTSFAVSCNSVFAPLGARLGVQ